MLRNKENGLRFGATLALLIVSPFALGAKGCNRAVVGDDGPCKTTSCAAGEDGMTGGSTGTTGGGGGKAGGSSGGTGGSKATGGTSGSTATGGGPATGGASGSTATGGTGTAGTSGGTATGGGPATGGASGTATGGSGGTATGGSGGEPGLGCGARAGDTCADTEFCSFAPGASCGRADATGTCETKPEVCDDLYKAVCGCDGMTYSNDCFANAAGVSVNTVGECAAMGGTCGGLRGSQCADGTFCDFPPDASCGAADQTGTCQPTPSACTKELDPVCGCDDKTYDNECLAHTAGVSVAATGACGSTPDFCGGIAGFTCPDGQYCNFPASAMCGAGDMTGACAPMPEACTQQYDPVCGCDGMTYGNACSAASAGVSVQATGQCPTK